MKKLLSFILFLFLAFNSTAQKQNVFISGAFLQTKMPSVNLLYYDLIKEDFEYISKATVSAKGMFEMRFELEEPVFCKFYEDFFYVTPGDTIHLSVTDDSLSSKRYKLKVTGRHASHYEFSDFLKLNSSIDIDKELKMYKNNWTEFQKICEKKYNTDIGLLNEYSVKHKVSKQFSIFYKDELYSQYLMTILLPFHTKKLENSLVIENYYKTIEIDTIFNSAELFRHLPFRQFCRDYLKFIVTAKAKSTGINNEYALLHQFINENYSGTVREYFLTFLFNNLIKLKKNESDKIVENIFANSNQFSDESLKTYVLKKYVLHSNVNQKLADSILSIGLSDVKGNKTELKKVIESLKGKYILIDNWASWCGPCLQEINNSKSFIKAGVLKKDSIEILYLSQDESRLNWKNTVSKNKSTMTNSYLYMSFPNAFSRYFNITSIPRYILLNKEGKLISLDAPRISEYPALLKLIK